jgi:MFS family permease
MRIYWISFALEFFYALMVVYTPLYLLDLGFGWDKIGIVFTIMLLPFVMFGYPAGLIADKKIGEKEMIIFGLLLMSISTFSIFFIHSSSLWPWAAILFVTRMGATLVETLRDSYFYKRIDGSDMDLISFFRTSRSTAYMIATAFSAIILVFFPVKAIFIFIGLAMLVAIYPAIKLEDNKSEAEKKRRKY